MKASNYAFATGKIRFLETKLPDKTDIERMIDAPDLDSSFKALYDTDYADNLLDVEPMNFEQAVLDDLKQAKDLIYQIVPDQDFIKLLLLDFDFHNLKVIFEGKLFNKKNDHLLSSLGYFDPEQLKKYLLGDQKTAIDLEIKLILDQASKNFNSEIQPYKIEAFFDGQYFILLKTIAQRLKNNFLIEFVSRNIDLNNLRIFLRLKNLGKEISVLEDFLISGGNLNKQTLLKLYLTDLKSAVYQLTKFLPHRCEKYFNEYLEKGSLWLLEKKLFEEEGEYFKKAKFISYGPEIVAAYFYAKKNANKDIRLIMNGKLNQISGQLLKERLRKLY